MRWEADEMWIFQVGFSFCVLFSLWARINVLLHEIKIIYFRFAYRV